MKKALIAAAILVLALPVAVLATLLLIPFWRWLEATTSMESIGHSGPAEWCFGAVYIGILFASFGAWLSFRSRSGT